MKRKLRRNQILHHFKLKGRKINITSYKQGYDTLRAHDAFRRVFSGYYFEGVKFQPLYSDKTYTCNDNIAIHSMDGKPCISICINGVYHPVFHMGKVAPVFMTKNQLSQVEDKQSAHDKQRFLITGIASAIKNDSDYKKVNNSLNIVKFRMKNKDKHKPKVTIV